MDRNRLLGVVVASALLVPGVSAAEGPWFYAVMGPGGSNEITVGQIGEVVYFELDSTTADRARAGVRSGSRCTVKGWPAPLRVTTTHRASSGSTR